MIRGASRRLSSRSRIAALLLCAVGLRSSAAAAPVSPAPAPDVLRSTAPAASIEDVAAIKRRIGGDQKEVLRARAAFKRAKARDDDALQARTREAWLSARGRLKADRDLLRKAIEAQGAGPRVWAAGRPSTRARGAEKTIH